MDKIICFLLIIITLSACNEREEISSINPLNWEKRTANHIVKDIIKDSLEIGETYLSIYSQIYSHSEHRTHNLTAMVSLRNTSDSDTIYITKAKYYDTKGKLLRNYFDKPIYLSPLETVEIIIDEFDLEGGTGANFIFDWKIPDNCPEPLFEAVMNSTLSQQGLSFTTIGRRVK
ncbi:DUF3124 domain-containing protein [Ulvibacter antarcticus]|uniref:Uncharacterized protein DUF3124 n=1 Tax=Ulvibacter antarcticus TaxID=442714 RepID=A0A3L9YRG5_9FLAO|nr:DUF3124 domain-containing protein [Ulvibacter antarcticus]RMA57062.1 uncharacterized protein DUF3124 [Ulvibacter antarcticus]